MLKAKELGLELDGPQLSEVVEQLKLLEHEGYHFEVADGSLELLMRRIGGWRPDWFDVESFRVITDDRRGVDTLTGETQATVMTEATVKLHVEGERHIATEEGNGPVNALDRAVRSALNGRFPALERVHLTDYKVRVLDTNKGTGAVTRVLIDSTDGDATWTTIGVNENIIEASWQALLDSIHYGLLPRPGQPVAFGACRPIRSSPPTPPTCPASNRTCRPAPRCRRRAAGGPIAPVTSNRRRRRVGCSAPPDPTSASRTRSPSTSPIASSSAEHEDIHDVIPVIAEIAGRRAGAVRSRARDPRRRGRDEHARLRRQRGPGFAACPRAPRARSRALVLPPAGDRRSGSRGAAAPAAR